MPKKILIMAGGTGGHVFPGLAIAEELKKHSATLAWLGTPQGIESRLVPQANIPLRLITISGVRGKGLTQKLASPFKLGQAVFQAIGHLRDFKPDLVIGLGGFASGPGGIAARLLNIPLVIHEQNAVAGMTNKVLSRFAKKILEAFPHTFPSKLHPLLIGNPVRSQIMTLSPPEERFQGRQGPLRLLILGGSRGATAINQALPKAICLLPENTIDLWHQTGESDLSTTQAAYADTKQNARVNAFIDDMAAAYDWADLVVCRAGALTVSELAAAGVASILIPFPFAVDDHQTKNAHYLVDKGAATLLPQSTLTAQRLADLLKSLTRDALLQQAKLAYSLRLPDASKQASSLCWEIIENANHH